MIQLLLISMGGAIGAVSRYSIGVLTSKIFRRTEVLTGTLFSYSSGNCFTLGWIDGREAIFKGPLIHNFKADGALFALITFQIYDLNDQLI